MSQPAPLDLEVAIDAPVTAVWDALVEDEHRRSWWSYLELDPRPVDGCSSDGRTTRAYRKDRRRSA